MAEIFGNLRFKDDDISGQQDSLNSVSQKEYQNSTSAGTVCISASILLYISIDNCVLTDVDIVTPCNQSCEMSKKLHGTNMPNKILPQQKRVSHNNLCTSNE